MYCNQCGKWIPDDAKFCHHCGSAVGVDQAQKLEESRGKTTEQSEPIVQDEELMPKKAKKQKLKTTKEKVEKKPIPADKKKKIAILAAAVVAIIAIVAGVIAIKNHQPVLAELPDPEYYFAEVGIDEIMDDNPEDDVKTIILRSDEDIWNYAAGYVNLLKWSGRYPVTQSDEQRESDGDYVWRFVYNDEEDIKNPHFCQIEVNYYNKSSSSVYYAVYITLHDLDAFDLVQKEQYTESDAAADFSDAGSSNDSGSVDSSTADNSGTDSGTTEETPTTDSSGNSNDSFVAEDDDDDEVPEVTTDYDNPTPCGVCNRSGDCGTCGGDGYLMSSASDEEDRNCYACSGSGNCRSCGGDGEL